jgi:large subunit ribosomal protein L10
VNRDEKAAFIQEVRGRFQKSSFVILTDWRGSTPLQMDKVRRESEKAGVHFQVVKNTLCRRALDGTGMEKLGSSFKGNIGVFFAGEDAQAAAKLFRAQKKDNDKLVCRGGFFEGIVLDDKGVDAVADLPSREEMLSTMLRTIQENPRRVLGVIQGPARDLMYLLNNYANKLEEQG